MIFPVSVLLTRTLPSQTCLSPIGFGLRSYSWPVRPPLWSVRTGSGREPIILSPGAVKECKSAWGWGAGISDQQWGVAGSRATLPLKPERMEKPNLQREEESGTHAARRRDGQGETRETQQQSLLLKELLLRPVCPPVLQLCKALEVFILHGI